jgi:UDP-glucose 4-epimerase
MELGYQPKAHFHEGLKKTVAWYLDEKEKSETPALRS